MTNLILASNGKTIMANSKYGYRIVMVCWTKALAARIMKGLPQ